MPMSKKGDLGSLLHKAMGFFREMIGGLRSTWLQPASSHSILTAMKVGSC
jgi:hypothetical protein